MFFFVIIVFLMDDLTQTITQSLVWWRRPEQAWKGCSQIGDRFAIRRLKESDKVHPQGYPLTRGWLQK